MMEAADAFTEVDLGRHVHFIDGLITHRFSLYWRIILYRFPREIATARSPHREAGVLLRAVHQLLDVD